MNRWKAVLLFILGIIMIAIPLTILIRERIDSRQAAVGARPGLLAPTVAVSK